MADWLLLRLPQGAEQEATWLTVDGQGVALASPESGSLELASSRVGVRRLCVLVPGSDVLLASPELPAKAGAKLQQIVPYALEEQLADDIDSLHFAVGKRPPDSPNTPVAVVERRLMDEWLAKLGAVGLKPERMHADSDLLPVNPGQAVALLEGDAVVVRPSGGSIVTLPADALAEALELVRPQEEITAQSGRGLILYTGAAEWQRHSQDVEAVRDRYDGVKVQLLSAGPLGLLAQQLPSGTAVNLLQGAYTPPSEGASGWRAWRVAAILLAVLIGLHIAGKSAQLFALKRTERAVSASMDETFRSAMPGEQNTLDARRRMERRLLSVRGGMDSAGLLPALGALVEARSAAPGTAVQALSFRDGALDLKLAAPDADSLERISQSLRSRGWQADLTSGNVTEGGYEGRIQIRAAGGKS
jgi:general secretion pathway protein L